MKYTVSLVLLLLCELALLGEAGAADEELALGFPGLLVV
jgi:hypothetical protein